MAENKPILGELLKGGEERDAIHIAILPVTADTFIFPGDKIFVRPDGLADVNGGMPNAVADPFLSEQIFPGQKFYALLFPYTIESLRHEWVHRDFPKPNPVASSEHEMWLMDFAESHYVDFNEMMMAADDLVTGHSDIMGICFGMDVDYDERQEFWERYGQLRGQFISNSVKEEYFSCSC